MEDNIFISLIVCLVLAYFAGCAIAGIISCILSTFLERIGVVCYSSTANKERFDLAAASLCMFGDVEEVYSVLRQADIDKMYKSLRLILCPIFFVYFFWFT